MMPMSAPSRTWPDVNEGVRLGPRMRAALGVSAKLLGQALSLHTPLSVCRAESKARGQMWSLSADVHQHAAKLWRCRPEVDGLPPNFGVLSADRGRSCSDVRRIWPGVHCFCEFRCSPNLARIKFIVFVSSDVGRIRALAKAEPCRMFGRPPCGIRPFLSDPPVKLVRIFYGASPQHESIPWRPYASAPAPLNLCANDVGDRLEPIADERRRTMTDFRIAPSAA